MHNYSQGSRRSVGDDLFFIVAVAPRQKHKQQAIKATLASETVYWNCQDDGWTESTGQFQFSPIPDLTRPPPRQPSDRLFFMIDGGDRFILKLRPIFQDPDELGEMDGVGGV